MRELTLAALKNHQLGALSVHLKVVDVFNLATSVKTNGMDRHSARDLAPNGEIVEKGLGVRVSLQKRCHPRGICADVQGVPTPVANRIWEHSCI